MYSSKEAALDDIGRGAFMGADKLASHLVVARGAGTPTATSTVPTFIGQIYVDTTNHKVYIAEDTDDVNGFLILN